MADKKITELQLRDNVSDDVNFPSDDGIQSYRVTAAQMKTYILADDAIETDMIEDLAVTTDKLAAGAVTDAKTAFTKPTIQTFTSGSGTYTTPTGVKWIRVRMAGGGGGPGAPDSGTSAGGAGGSTTFGTSLLTAPGGSGSPGGPGGLGGDGATAPTINSPAIGKGWAGEPGQNGAYLADTNGGDGGSTALFGGRGRGGYRGLNGGAAVANTGCGGGGGGGFSALASSGGGGGGATIDAIIPSPGASYSYAVGAAGTPGSVGGSGIYAGTSAAGIIIVEEHYQ